MHTTIYLTNHKMDIPFENYDFSLTLEDAEHINERHVDLHKSPRASKFYPKFNLTACWHPLRGTKTEKM